MLLTLPLPCREKLWRKSGHLLLWYHDMWGKTQPGSIEDCELIFWIISPHNSCFLKIIGRVSADPDYLPRANDFSLNVARFLQLYHTPDCPSAFLPLAVLCCDMDAENRYEGIYTFVQKKKKQIYHGFHIRCLSLSICTYVILHTTN